MLINEAMLESGSTSCPVNTTHRHIDIDTDIYMYIDIDIYMYIDIDSSQLETLNQNPLALRLGQGVVCL